MTTVRIPPTLRDEIGGERAGSRRRRHRARAARRPHEPLPRRCARSSSSDDEIAPFVNVYVEGEDVRTLDGLDTPVAIGSTVILLPAMAGG